MTGTLVYLYAVLRQPLDLDITGIDSAPVRWVKDRRLAAAVSDVSGAEFEEEPLNAHVRDMAWLGPRAIAHQDVNQQLFEASEAIVPLAFGTVFRDDEPVRRLLRDQSQQLEDQLQRVRGCAEWVLALHALREPEVQESPRVQAMLEDIASSSPGRAHLLRRQLATVQRDEAHRLESETATDFYETLRRIAREVFREPLPSDAVERPLLRASVLVRRDADLEFMDHVDRLRQRWPEPTYRVLLTGPWPPYRFAGLQRDAA